METVFRVAIIYVFILFGLRILGKREFGQLSPAELLTLMLIPEIVSQSLTRDDFSLTNALVGVSTLLVLVFLTATLVHKSDKFAEIVAGKAVVLAFDGKLIESAMNRERVPPNELYTEMRKAGVERLADVEWAVLEPDGRVSVVPKQGDATQTDDGLKV